MASRLDEITDIELLRIAASCTSLQQIARSVGYNGVSGPLYKNLTDRLESVGVDTTSYTRSKPKSYDLYTNEQLFKDYTNSDDPIASSTIREHYYHRHISEYVCSICGQEPTWKDQPLTLMLDHIDGNNRNHQLDNLRWVCPNCNSQLPTTGGRNVYHRHISKCIECGKQINDGATRCLACEYKHRKDSHQLPISRDELKTKIRRTTFLKIASEYHVSDNAVRKWCTRYNLPFKKKEIKSYTDEEWKLV